MVGVFTRKTTDEPAKFNFIAYYIDSGGSAEQKEALRKLLSGPSFAGLGQPAELKDALNRPHCTGPIAQLQQRLTQAG